MSESARTCLASFAQQRLWFVDRLEPDSPLYNVRRAVRLTGPLDVRVLERSLREIVRRHETLRTSFALVDGQLHQVIARSVPFAITVRDLGGFPEEQRAARLDDVLRAEAQQPFDLSTAPLIRATVVKVGAAEHVLLLTIHHIVFDGWSMGVLDRELGALYRAFSSGEPSPLVDLPIQYADYAVRERESLSGDALLEQLAYWRNQLSEVPILDLPTDRPRTPALTNRGARLEFMLPPRVANALSGFVRQERVTPFMVLLALWQRLLALYTQQNDVAVGVPVAGRNHPDVEGLIGFFVNTLVFRTDLSGDPSLRQLVQRVRDFAFGAYAHQDVPFEKLVEELRPDRKAARTPFIQVMFALQNTPRSPLDIAGVKSERFDHGDTGTAKFELTIDMFQEAAGLRGRVEYNCDLFERTTVERLADHFGTLIEDALSEPDRPMSRLSVLSPAERERLVVLWNASADVPPERRDVRPLFEEQVQRTPNAVAVVSAAATLTYSELDRRANQLAHRLQGLGVEPGTCVSVCLERSIELVVALLGVLKAGAAYVPLDPASPAARQQAVLADAGVGLVVTRLGEAAWLTAAGDRWRRVDVDDPALEAELEAAVSRGPTGLAYVMYTSGSTGAPKGVAVPHEAIVRLVRGAAYAPLDASDVVAHLSNPAFDAATFEIWGALLNGARLVILDAEDVLSPRRFGALLAAQGVTVLFVTTALFNVMVREQPGAFASVRQLFFGGEAADPRAVRTLLTEGAPARLVHVYGPTETTTFATSHEVRAVGEGAFTVPIGRPIAHTRVYVLDEQGELVPMGVPGELYIGGLGLGWGYWNDPGLTAERFVPDAISGRPGERLYRTGDRVRWRADGTLEFLARLDDQIKLRGFRIEPKEIEAALTEHPAVRAAVVARDNSSGDRTLVAYVVPSGPLPNRRELRRFLGARLPPYALPSQFVAIDALPLNRNGKVDRKALPPSPLEPSDGGGDQRPSDDLERKLLDLWERVLNVRGLRVTDNFFDVGGHSLLAVRLFCEIEREWGRDLQLATLFHAPTIEQLAAALRDASPEPPWGSLVALQPGGTWPPLFLVHAVGGNLLTYRELALALAPDQPVFGLQAVGLDRRQTPYNRIDEMAAHYVKEIRAVQATGPYRLGGASFGGVVAFEMARQLHAEGETVVLLAMFDSGPPGEARRVLSAAKVRNLGERAAHLARNLVCLPACEKGAYVRARLKTLRRRLRSRIWRAVYRAYARSDQPLPARLQSVKESAFLAFREYRPVPYAGRVTLFRAKERGVGGSTDPTCGWGRWAAGGVEVREVPGDHVTMMTEPHVRVLSARLRECLAELRSGGETNQIGKAPGQDRSETVRCSGRSWT